MARLIRAFFDAHPGWEADPDNMTGSWAEHTACFTPRGEVAFVEWGYEQGHFTCEYVARAYAQYWQTL
jgi:hypothetical protein